jgi:DnaJ-class molecular chaperone
MTLEYSAILDVSGKCEAVRKRVVCVSCSGEKRTLFGKVCRTCDGTGYTWEEILVHESTQRTD